MCLWPLILNTALKYRKSSLEFKENLFHICFMSSNYNKPSVQKTTYTTHTHKCALNVQMERKLSLVLYPLPRRSLVLIFLTLSCSNNVHAAAAAAKSLQSCPTLCDPIDCSPSGSSVHGIFQARVLEWVAIAFSSMMSLLGNKYVLSDF